MANIPSFGSLDPRIDDRRNEEPSLAVDMLRQLGASLDTSGQQMPPVTPLGEEAGINEIVPGHGRWLLKRLMEEAARAKADNAVHTFNGRIERLKPDQWRR